MGPSTGNVIYGIEARASYALGSFDERALFDMGADLDLMLAHSVQAQEGYIQPQELGALPIVDFELILAHFCIKHFDDVVGHNLNCEACGKKYAVEFSLGTYLGMLTSEVHRHTNADFRGYPLALPSRDIIANAGSEGLVTAIWAKTDPISADDLEALESYLEKACPILQEDVGGPCPECQTAQTFRFILRDWVAAKLQTRLKGLIAQIHLLATHYHWRVDDIFALSRASRLALIDTIQGRTTRLTPAGTR